MAYPTLTSLIGQGNTGQPSWGSYLQGSRQQTPFKWANLTGYESYNPPTGSTTSRRFPWMNQEGVMDPGLFARFNQPSTGGRGGFRESPGYPDTDWGNWAGRMAPTWANMALQAGQGNWGGVAGGVGSTLVNLLRATGVGGDFLGNPAGQFITAAALPAITGGAQALLGGGNILGGIAGGLGAAAGNIMGAFGPASQWAAGMGNTGPAGDYINTAISVLPMISQASEALGIGLESVLQPVMDVIGNLGSAGGAMAATFVIKVISGLIEGFSAGNSRNSRREDREYAVQAYLEQIARAMQSDLVVGAQSQAQQPYMTGIQEYLGGATPERRLANAQKGWGDSQFARDEQVYNPTPNVTAETQLVSPMEYLTASNWGQPDQYVGDQSKAFQFDTWLDATQALGRAVQNYGTSRGYNIPIDQSVLNSVGSWGVQKGTGTDIFVGSVDNPSAQYAAHIGEGYQGSPQTYETDLLEMKVVQLPNGKFSIVKETLTPEGLAAAKWVQSTPVVDYDTHTVATGQYNWAQEAQRQKNAIRNEIYKPLMDPSLYKPETQQKLSEAMQYSPLFDSPEGSDYGEGSVLRNMIRFTLRNRFPQWFGPGTMNEKNPNLNFLQRYSIYRMIENQVANQQRIRDYWRRDKGW